jgi:hypothetical protein
MLHKLPQREGEDERPARRALSLEGMAAMDCSLKSKIPKRWQ